MINLTGPAMNKDILTPEEFAQRLKIGRSTLFDWIRSGVLASDIHYVKVGRVLRFVWRDDVLFTLKKPTKAKTNVPRSQQSKINMDC
jgi:excisionase family DNA binding protein